MLGLANMSGDLLTWVGLGSPRDRPLVNKDHDYRCSGTENFDNGLPTCRIEVIYEGNKVLHPIYSLRRISRQRVNHKQQIKFQSRFLSAMPNLSRCGISREVHPIAIPRPLCGRGWSKFRFSPISPVHCSLNKYVLTIFLLNPIFPSPSSHFDL